MILNLKDYEGITLRLDETDYFIFKKSIGISINRIDGEPMNVKTKKDYEQTKSVCIE